LIVPFVGDVQGIWKDPCFKATTYFFGNWNDVTILILYIWHTNSVINEYSTLYHDRASWMQGWY